jgi:hypothetical protein
MSRITDLPDDFDEALDLDKVPEPETSIEDLYYEQFQKDGVKKPNDSTKSFEEIMSDFSKTPLFMNNLDVAGEAGMRLLSKIDNTSLNKVRRWTK